MLRDYVCKHSWVYTVYIYTYDGVYGVCVALRVEECVFEYTSPVSRLCAFILHWALQVSHASPWAPFIIKGSSSSFIYNREKHVHTAERSFYCHWFTTRSWSSSPRQATSMCVQYMSVLGKQLNSFNYQVFCWLFQLLLVKWWKMPIIGFTIHNFPNIFSFLSHQTKKNSKSSITFWGIFARKVIYQGAKPNVLSTR